MGYIKSILKDLKNSLSLLTVIPISYDPHFSEARQVGNSRGSLPRHEHSNWTFRCNISCRDELVQSYFLKKKIEERKGRRRGWNTEERIFHVGAQRLRGRAIVL